MIEEEGAEALLFAKDLSGGDAVAKKIIDEARGMRAREGIGLHPVKTCAPVFSIELY